MRGRKAGPPADDPFEGEEAPVALASTAADHTKSKVDHTESPIGAAPQFSFETIGAMDDASLAAGMRELLKATARYGASDLHLSAGVRPFIRMQRAIKSLSDYVLTTEDARRLNLALLTPAQRETFERIRDFDYQCAIIIEEVTGKGNGGARIYTGNCRNVTIRDTSGGGKA